LEFEPDHLAFDFQTPEKLCRLRQFPVQVSSLGLFWFKDRLVILLVRRHTAFEARCFTRGMSLPRFDADADFTGRFFISSSIENHQYAVRFPGAEDSTPPWKTVPDSICSSGKEPGLLPERTNSNGMVMKKLKTMRQNRMDADCQIPGRHLDRKHQCYKQAEIYSNILSGLMDARASIVGNNLRL